MRVGTNELYIFPINSATILKGWMLAPKSNRMVSDDKVHVIWGRGAKIAPAGGVELLPLNLLFVGLI